MVTCRAFQGEDRIETLRGLPPTSDGDIHARINSIPPGADIQVDGTYVGITPLEIDLPCCFHDVTISNRGRKPWAGRGPQQRPPGDQRPIAEISKEFTRRFWAFTRPHGTATIQAERLQQAAIPM